MNVIDEASSQRYNNSSLNQNYNVTDQKSIFSPNGKSSIISEDQQRRQYSPFSRATKNTEKLIQKYDKQIKELKDQMLDGTLSQHVYTKKIEKLVKEKYNIIEQAG